MSKRYSDKVFEYTQFFPEGDKWLENVRIFQIGETCLDKGAVIGVHKQFCNEITFIISGEGTLYADGLGKKCVSGYMQIVSKGVEHDIEADKDCRLRYIHFAFEFSDNLPEQFTDFFDNCGSIIICDDGNIGKALKMLIDEYYNDEMALTDLVRSSLANIILVTVWRNINEKTLKYSMPVERKPIGELIYGILRHIEKNITKQLTVRDLSKNFSYSPSHISHLFKEKMGISVKEYIIKEKMKYASNLLREGILTVSEIAEQIGYGSIQSFSKTFKLYMGCSPTEYRSNK